LENYTTFVSAERRVLQITSARSAAELVRISVLALLRTVIITTSGDKLYRKSHEKDLARKLLSEVGDEFWKGHEEIQLWVLVIQTLTETGSSRPWFLDQISRVMSLQSWDYLMYSLHQVVWIENIALQEMALLKSELQRHLKATQSKSVAAPEMAGYNKLG